MPVSRLEVLERSAYEGGRSFGATGAYERVDATAHYAVDPGHAANASISDLALAERGEDGRVHFQGDVTLLRPVDAAAGNRALLLQVPNRGKRSIPRLDMSSPGPEPTPAVSSGDGFLLEAGWSIVFAGWQWDMPRTADRARIGLIAPRVRSEARAPDTRMQLRIQPAAPASAFPLTDQHVGDIGRHQPIAARDVEQPDAQLLVRERPYDVPREVPRARWRFARDVAGAPVADDGHVWLDGGFEPGLIYDILYTPRDCPVVGAGLLAVRDLATFLRHAEDSPLAGNVAHVIGEGHSQCGRFLRTFLHLGLNNDEVGRTALDGVLIHVAGARRGEFNHRYGQPSVQPTPSFGHLFPFADEPQTDPRTGQRAGLLDAQRAAGGMPKIVYTDTSAEYWRGDAALAHTDLESGGDASLPDNVRRYLLAGSQHGQGEAQLTPRTPFGSAGANDMNVVDYRPLYRAALVNLLAWVAEGVAPPASVFPTAAGGTRARRAEVIASLSRFPGLATPDPDVMTTMFPLDLGPRAARGLADLPAAIAGEAYPDWVAAVDADGNEVAGIAMPDVSVPVATHTGFNPRDAQTGGTGQLLEYVGSTVPFAPDAATRVASDDPRASIAERYAGRDDYLARVRGAAEALVAKRHLLTRDVELCVAIAARRYDLCKTREEGVKNTGGRCQ